MMENIVQNEKNGIGVIEMKNACNSDICSCKIDNCCHKMFKISAHYNDYFKNSEDDPLRFDFMKPNLLGTSGLSNVAHNFRGRRQWRSPYNI